MTGPEDVDAVVCGAGIAGIAAAHALVRDAGLSRVLIVDEGAPLSLTSDKSTECYRNWWPGPGNAMTALTTRSIDLMEALASTTGNAIQMDRRGYLYLSANPQMAEHLEATARESESLGAGALRIHTGACDYEPRRLDGFGGQPEGADLILDRALIAREFPYAAPGTCVALHVRRAGALSAQQLGMVLLEQARKEGARLLRGRLTGVERSNGAVSSVVVRTDSGERRINTPVLVDSAGPYLEDVAALAGVDVPVVCERHVKLTFDDRESVVPRDAPLSIWCDPTPLPWSSEEAEALAGDEAGAKLLEPFPAGVHGRPLGRAGHSLMLYWTYDCPIEPPTFPITWEPDYPEILLRGMSVMIPGLECYYEHMPNAYLDGGYYTKTQENRPLIGPTPVAGFYLCGAFSGFGIMTAMGAADLLAAHVAGAPLPEHADPFRLSRYEDPEYRTLLENWPADGQI